VQMMGLFGAPAGADCISCPTGAREWVLEVDVDAYGTREIILSPATLVVTYTGVFSLPVTAALANSGLPSDPQPPARAQYALDRGVASVNFVSASQVEYVKPGTHSLDFVTGPERFLGCYQDVEADLGLGYGTACKLGDCFAVTGTLPSSSSSVWKLRVRSDNNLVSEEVTKTLVTDDSVPNVQITPVNVLSGSFVRLVGVVQDVFPVGPQPMRVEVSKNGGRFFPAFVSTPGVTPLVGRGSGDAQTARSPLSGDGEIPRQARNDVAETETTWSFPLQLTDQDGQQIAVVARAIDQAGNVGPESEPMTVTLDAVGPAITVTQTSPVIEGTVWDGSGVASVEVSLDGGAGFQPAHVSEGAWTFDLALATGPREGFVILRAEDRWGNLTHQMVVLPARNVFLPLVLK